MSEQAPMDLEEIRTEIKRLIDNGRRDVYDGIIALLETRARDLWQNGAKALKYRWSDDTEREARTRHCEARDLIEALKQLDPSNKST